jgi:hypothetical protein
VFQLTCAYALTDSPSVRGGVTQSCTSRCARGTGSSARTAQWEPYLRVARRLIARDAASGGGFGEASCHDGAHTDVRQSTQTSGASVHTVWYDTTIVFDLADYAGRVGGGQPDVNWRTKWQQSLVAVSVQHPCYQALFIEAAAEQ